MNELANPMNMLGRNVVVTGAAQGIGKAVADLLYALGADLTLMDMNGEALDAAAADYEPARVLALRGSVTDRDFLAEMVGRSAERFGAIRGLVNNAGITRTAMINKMTADQWQAVIDVNLTGVFNCLQAVGRQMATQKPDGGENAAIVNISSDAGRKGTIGQINYSAAKAGLLGMTMSASREWGKHAVRVNSVAYGIVETEMTEVVRSEKFRDRYLSVIPLGRFLAPREAANAVAFLVSPASVFITGQHLSVNGGSHMAG